MYSISQCFRKSVLLAAQFVAVFSFFASSSAQAAVITNDAFFKDTSGNPIYSQGGGVFKFGSKYYWYGVKYNGAVTYYNSPTGKNSDTSFNAVTCYSSTDLVNWTFENNVLTSSTSGLSGISWFGRMGVVYNATTGKYVLLAQCAYTSGTTGEFFATCSTPTGNFAFNNVQYPVPGVVNNTTGDQTVFTDTDGTSYLVCSSSSGRSNWYVARIRPSDSLAIETAVRIGGGTGREGNCMFKYNGRYYFCSSDLHGWNASHCYVISSTSIQGTYSSESVMNNTDLDFCHVTQTGFFVTVTGTSGTVVIFCGDRWCDFAGNGIGYNQWCPVTFSGTTPIFNSVSKWDLNASAGTWSVAAGNNYILNPSFEADRVSQATLAGWSNWTNLGSATPYSNKSGGHTGNWSAQHMYTSAYQASTHQVVKGPNGAALPSGTYTLTCWVKSSGGQPTCQIFVKSFGGTEIDSAINTAISSWTKVTISNINITNGQADVGLWSIANANQWAIVDDWQLTKN
jgi:hypothetical protein